MKRKHGTFPEEEAGIRALQQDGGEISGTRVRIKTLSLVLAVLLLLGLGTYASAAVVTRVRSFPVFFDRSLPGTALISLSEDPGFAEPTVKLAAPVPASMTNISGFSLPENVDEGSGSHNGTDYVAYGFYVRNDGEEALLHEKVSVIFSGRNADEAVRVRVYRNGVHTTYAKAAADGLPEPGTVPFVSADTVFDESSVIPAGQEKKYTIVIWLEGDDPDCTDAIRGGSVRLSMEFSAETRE